MPRPKSKASVTSSGRSEAVFATACESRPSAVAPRTLTALPLPPVPAPKQVALGLVLIETVPVFSVCSVSTLLPLPTTRSVALVPAASAAEQPSERDRTRASAQSAAARWWLLLGIEPPFPRGSCWLAADRSPGFLGLGRSAPSRGLCVAPSGRRRSC